MPDLGYSYRINEGAVTLPMYLCTLGVNTVQNAVLRPNGIEHHQLLFCRESRGFARLNGAVIPLQRGDIFFLPPHAPHKYEPEVVGTWRTDWISFGGTAVTALLPTDGGIWHSDDLDVYLRLLAQMQAHDFMLDYRANSLLLYELLLRFHEETLRKKGINVPRTQERLQPVLTFMQHHFTEPLTIRELATQIHVSNEQFCRIFHSVCHTRPMAYLNFLRITHAKKLMCIQPQLSIHEIAQQCGFGNSSYFGRLFLRTEGISATVWRSQHTLMESNNLNKKQGDFP